VSNITKFSFKCPACTCSRRDTQNHSSGDGIALVRPLTDNISNILQSGGVVAHKTFRRNRKTVTDGHAHIPENTFFK